MKSAGFKLVVFGLSMSSSWGNGHATLWRGLASALSRLGHRFVFFEKDVPWYAEHRDAVTCDGAELILYRDFEHIRGIADRHLQDADAAMVTSYCPDATFASEVVLQSSAPVKAFYDLDAGVSLERAARGVRPEYIPSWGLSGFDLVLSYVGGSALDGLKKHFGARVVLPLYGSVDPAVYHPVETRRWADFSYLGTYAPDRQLALDELFLEPARRLPHKTFVLGGSMYPSDFPWAENIHFRSHVAPPDHPAFYCSASATLNVTRGPMAAYGYCPPARLFEAAACGVPVISDWWEGLDTFFTPGDEIIVGKTAEHVASALELGPERLAQLGVAARDRALMQHTARERAKELVAILTSARTTERTHTVLAGA